MSGTKRRSGCWSRVLSFVVVLAGMMTGGGSFTYNKHVLESPGDHMSRASIMQVIAQESPILYRDGETRLGVFFSREHREYVPFERIPRAWVQAIVAAEDQGFWSHPGIDVRGIARAMWQNIRVGRMVAGGSSLTQQTAKNLFYRPDRSLKSKWGELINALRLEALYSKEDILEFYANQFHVSSNGRGLGIAARYFFDKDVAELSTLECAFIAGMVKAPSRYNPFIGDAARQERSKKRAQSRTRYVLDRMLAEGVLTESVHAQLASEAIPFRRGRFQYESSIIVDAVGAQLVQAPFPRLFEQLGIDNPSTAGISIVTTLDAAAQRAATYGLWHHLSDVGPRMEGLSLADLVNGAEAMASQPVHALTPRHFYRGQVTVSAADGVLVDIGGLPCTVDKVALKRAAGIIARAKRGNRWAKASAADRAAVHAALQPGSAVWVSVRPGGEQSRCDLEFRPELQGAVMLLEQGQIRAMVGGNDNRNFNRALEAKRQLGSTWKPLLYLAALQLGWTPIDALDNRPNVFHFEGTWYYPRADHKSESWSSMSWAGTRSENLASIYLLAHITDRLNPAQFKEVAAMVDLVQRDGEGRTEFVRRIRDEHGVISTAAWLPALAFGAARLELVGHLGVDTPAGRELMSMSYGRGLDKERARVDAAGGRRHAGKTTALNRTYRHLARVGTRCLQQVGALRAYSNAVADSRASSGWGWPLRRAASPPLAPSVESFGDLVTRVQDGEASIGCGELGSEWIPVDGPFLDWIGLGGVADWDDAAVSVNGGIPLSLLAELHGMMKRRMLVWEGADPYEMGLLQYHPDYRVLVGMSYVSHLAQTMGVREPLPPVLSMPLGAVDLSLASAATMYQGMMDAQMWTFPGWRASPSDGGPRAAVASPKQPAQLISEIRDRAGRVLYRADPMPRPIADASAGRLTGDILRNVVRWGTGRRAAGARVSGQPIPLAGKTGTTNGYRNAAFAGFVPRLNAGEWRWGEGFTLAVYVGYDDNRSMVRAGSSLQGSNGALPVWLSTVEGMAEAGLLGQPDSSVGLEWLDEPQYKRVSVVAGSGLMNSVPDDSVELARTVLVLGNPWQTAPSRQFAPVGAGARPLTAVPTAPLEWDAALPVDALDDQPSDL